MTAKTAARSIRLITVIGVITILVYTIMRVG